MSTPEPDATAQELEYRKRLSEITNQINSADSTQEILTAMPEKIVELMRLGEGDEPVLAVSLEQIVESFYGVPSFPTLESERAIRQAIAEGVRDGTFGYVSRTGEEDVSRLLEKGGYLVSRQAARISVDLPEATVDLGSGFIVLPQAIEVEAPEEPPPLKVGAELPPAGETVAPPGVSSPAPSGPGPQTTVRLSMRMNRQQLYASFDAIGNLAREAGTIRMIVEAEKPEGFDPNWLRNAVHEPLDEADVEVEDEQN